MEGSPLSHSRIRAAEREANDPRQLGNRKSNRLRIVLVATALAAVGVVLAATLVGSESTARAVDVSPAVEAGVKQDQQNLQDLTEVVLTSHPEMIQVLIALNLTMPVDGSAPTPLSSEQLSTLEAAVDEAATSFAELPGGGSEYNVGRNSFVLSVSLFGDVIDVLQTEPDLRPITSELASHLRKRALDAWSIGATQLDIITIDTTGGHLHASLPLAPVGDEAPDSHGH